MTGWISELLNRVRLRNLSTPERALDSYDRGVAAIGSGKTAQAIKHFADAISAAPDSSKLYHHRADAFALNGQHLEAIADYDAAVRIDAAYPDTYLDRGNSRYALGHLEAAVKDFSEAIRLNPDWAEAYANRAVAHAEFEHMVESDQDASKATSLGIDSDRLSEMLGAARSASGGESDRA
jgi:tetratricopeptide (TPR) repeat protein